jgi:predicted metal-dependent phosphoesterase TrpH
VKADLHVHSTASDGTLRPADLVALALQRGLSVLAIADHDSVEGLPEAMGAAAGTSLALIPAVELSSVTPEGGDVHMLGYFIRADDAHLLRHLADLRSARLRRAETMVGALNAAGYRVTLDDVLELSEGGAVGRSHVARALVAAGHAESVADAFKRLIGRERPFYVSKDVRSPQDAIRCIREAGGLAVVAHPGVSRLERLIPELADAGLAGIEAYHADHSAEERVHFATIAAEMRLLATGGSDFHGYAAPNPPLGSVDIPAEAISAFLAAGPS